jgi:membrane protein DedA with SNARE-associated domain
MHPARDRIRSPSYEWAYHRPRISDWMLTMPPTMHIFAASVTGFMATYGLLAIFVVMLLKEIGVPLPVPGDLIMLSAAGQAAAGQLVLWQAFLAILVALVLGDWLQYTLVRGVGRPLLYRFGRCIGLTPARLDAASAKVDKSGVLGVALAMTTPGVRNVVVPACGLARMPNRTFLPGLAVGCAVFLAIHFVIGYIGLPVVAAAIHAVGVPTLALFLALAGVGFAGWLVIRRTHRRGGTEIPPALESASDWADACCPVCLALGAVQAARQGRRSMAAEPDLPTSGVAAS